ncbi:MgtC/SapB family protein [Natronosporangium hydrolyticum]|uniref:MgtC/SapB family protein n=1 Tax=Natronosporangium hydrolyticum TaxID=2811111 RepID=A0A895YR28_9ACTN|nr:MgtC/SapB family protein [Natronosporangium hydrolyticum]
MRLLCAVSLGALVGVERQWRARMAGLRTNALVATGAALFVLMSFDVVDEISPTRVAAQVVSGIGFLGAGVILRDGINVRGLNTAATLWCAAAVGVLAGSGMYAGAAAGAAVVLVANLALRPVARRIERLPTDAGSEVETTYRLRITCREDQEAHVRALLLHTLTGSSFALHALRSEDVEPNGRVHVEAELVAAGRVDSQLEQAVSRLSLEPGVTAVQWRALDPARPLP